MHYAVARNSTAKLECLSKDARGARVSSPAGSGGRRTQPTVPRLFGALLAEAPFEATSGRRRRRPGHRGARVRVRARGQPGACRSGTRASRLPVISPRRRRSRPLPTWAATHCWSHRRRRDRSQPASQLRAPGAGVATARAVAGSWRCGGTAPCLGSAMAQHVRAGSRLAAPAAGCAAEVSYLRALPNAGALAVSLTTRYSDAPAVVPAICSSISRIRGLNASGRSSWRKWPTPSTSTASKSA